MAVNAVLRQRLGMQRGAVQTSAVTIPAPVGGLNARDALEAMPATDALELDNWWPESGFVTIRPGYSSHGTGVGTGDVETIAAWRGESGSKLIAAGGGAVYNVTSSGTGAAISGANVYASNRWQTVNFKSRLFGFNGTDAPWDYDGTTWTATAWTGPTKANLIQADVFKTRLLIVEKDSASFWYPAIAGAVTGALTEFDLSTVVRFGGTLQAVGTWTMDSGDGLDDRAVFVMSTGEILIYQGTDPGTANAWSLVGSYQSAPPIGRRCLTKLGGDLIVLTEAGFLPVSMIAQGWSADRIIRDTAWGKIAPLVHDLAVDYRDNWGWQASELLPGNKIYFNVPIGNSTFHVYAINTVTGAWARGKGLDARAWGVYDGAVYFGGGSGVVYKHAGTTDAGTAITAYAKGAYQHGGSQSVRKRFTAIKPYLTARGTLSGVRVGADLDYYDRRGGMTQTSLVGTEGTPWGSPWGSPWGQEFNLLRQRVSIRGTGRAISPKLEVTAQELVRWSSTEIIAETGGIL